MTASGQCQVLLLLLLRESFVPCSLPAVPPSLNECFLFQQFSGLKLSPFAAAIPRNFIITLSCISTRKKIYLCSSSSGTIKESDFKFIHICSASSLNLTNLQKKMKVGMIIIRRNGRRRRKSVPSKPCAQGCCPQSHTHERLDSPGELMLIKNRAH